MKATQRLDEAAKTELASALAVYGAIADEVKSAVNSLKYMVENNREPYYPHTLRSHLLNEAAKISGQVMSFASLIDTLQTMATKYVIETPEQPVEAESDDD